MTPRELAAHTQVAESSRNLTLDMFAHIQAALHNGPLTRDDKKLWTPAMFRPGAVVLEEHAPAPRKTSLQLAKEAAARMEEAQKRREGNSEPDNSGAQVIQFYEERSRRALEAQAAGYSREVIDRIMQGVG